MAVVNIPNPCPLKLNQLSPVDGGFFCSQCSKVVIDFRERADEEIISALKNSEKGRVCGVYQHHQVNNKSKPTFEVMRFVASLLLAFGVTLFASCGSDETYKIGDSLAMGDSVSMFELEAQMKADSTRLADSVAKTNRTK